MLFLNGMIARSQVHCYLSSALQLLTPGEVSAAKMIILATSSSPSSYKEIGKKHWMQTLLTVLTSPLQF